MWASGFPSLGHVQVASSLAFARSWSIDSSVRVLLIRVRAVGVSVELSSCGAWLRALLRLLSVSCRAAEMPVRRGHVAPQNSYIETIIRKFDELSTSPAYIIK